MFSKRDQTDEDEAVDCLLRQVVDDRAIADRNMLKTLFKAGTLELKTCTSNERTCMRCVLAELSDFAMNF